METQSNKPVPDKMASRILLCGIGPVPLGNPDRLYGPGLRVWGFARALVEGGCAVDLLEVRFGTTAQGLGARRHRMRPDTKAGAPTTPAATADSHIDTEDLSPASPEDLVARCLAEASYDAVVATTDAMSDACAQRCGDLPLWCDFFGHPMAERQGLATRYESDEGLTGQWDAILAPLLRGDRFSGCCEAQRLAVTGELGACGRLNRLTDGQDLVVSLRPAAVFTDFAPVRNVLRPAIVPDDAFAILWTGGYNTWADAETLAKALVEAMGREPRIHYVSTGGAIEGHDDRTFARFRAAMESSPVAARCHFVGWVATRDVPSYYAQADVGVNCDRRTLEGELGTRNRVLDWVCARLPVVTTDLCELTHDLTARELIDTFEIGDAAGLAGRFVRMAREPREPARARAERARQYVLEHYTPARLYGDLVAWARAPGRAPDLAGAGERMPRVSFGFPGNPLSRRRAAEWLATRSGKQGSARGRIARRLRTEWTRWTRWT